MPNKDITSGVKFRNKNKRTTLYKKLKSLKKFTQKNKNNNFNKIRSPVFRCSCFSFRGRGGQNLYD